MNWLSLLFLLRRPWRLWSLWRLCTLDCEVVLFSTLATIFSPCGTFFSTSHMLLTTKFTRYHILTTLILCFFLNLVVSNKLGIFLIPHRTKLCRCYFTLPTNIDALIQYEFCLLKQSLTCANVPFSNNYSVANETIQKWTIITRLRQSAKWCKIGRINGLAWLLIRQVFFAGCRLQVEI